MDDDTITPGLLNLNMNNMYVLDVPMIQDEIEALSSRQQVEHSCVWNVLQNMKAILKTRLPRQKIYAKEDLEEILKRDKNNLNALADLQHMYRGLHRISDAERCKTVIKEILTNDTVENSQYRAICLMEQGYAVLHDMSANFENIANSKLNDTHKMLQTEFVRSDENRRELLRKCIFHNKQTIGNLEQSIGVARRNEYFIRKIDSLKKFEKALSLSPDLPFRNAWSFYIGLAWNRHVDSIQRSPPNDKKQKTKEVIEATYKALEIFMDIVKMEKNMEKKDTYVSRSLALIGHILTKRKKCLEHDSFPFKYKNDKEYTTYFDNNMLPLRKAYGMQVKRPDSFVMNKYGRALYNLALKKTGKEKKHILEDALLVLSTSIDSFEMNWFAYSSRMQVSEALGDLTVELYDTTRYNRDTHTRYFKNKVLKEMESTAWTHYEQALEDGHKCFSSKCSTDDMIDVARICQKMSKCPQIKNYGHRYVSDEGFTYLHYALDYLQQGLTLAGPYDYPLVRGMASCLYDLDEIVSASEWMKRALALSDRLNVHDIKLSCLYHIKRYVLERNSAKPPLYLAREVFYTLFDCKRKCILHFKDKCTNASDTPLKGDYQQVIHVYEYIIRNVMDDITLVLEDVAAAPGLLNEGGLVVVKEMLETALKSDSLDSKTIGQLQTLRDTFENIQVVEENEMSLDDEYKQSSAPIPVSENRTVVSEGFQYDFFISHSQMDSDWVNGVLLFELETKLTEDDFAFKGCIADRDFIPGQTIISNITDAIKNSSKIILVLTKHFIQSRWCKDEMERALFRHISLQDCVIPLKLDISDDEVPDCLCNITYQTIDLTNERERVQQISRVKKALLPGDGQRFNE